MLPLVAVVAVMIGTFALPIAGRVLFATMGAGPYEGRGTDVKYVNKSTVPAFNAWTSGLS